MAGANVKEFTDSNFDSEVIQSSEPVLVDFWAPWCGPCRKLGPVIDDLAATNEGAVKVGKVNIDDNQRVASKYGIQAIPTMLVFKGGQVVNMLQGLQSKERIQQVLDATKG
ncbi:MAG TPA: thioredoxin [Pirellulales bacterium]